MTGRWERLEPTESRSGSEKSVIAVVVHYGPYDSTIRAVRYHFDTGVFASIVVVSNDLSSRPRELKGIGCEWVIPTRNLGYAGACRLAVESHDADIYAFFNAHITIDRQSAIRCIAALRAVEVGIASPFLYHPGSKRPDEDWKYTYSRRSYTKILRRPIQMPISEAEARAAGKDGTLIDQDWATGGALFCRQDVMRYVGWDGSYFLGYEDTDLSIRAKKCGLRIVVVPNAIAYHTGGFTKAKDVAAYYMARNALWFARRHRSRTNQAMLSSYMLLLLVRICAADAIRRRRPVLALPMARGIISGLATSPRDTDPLPNEPLWGKH